MTKTTWSLTCVLVSTLITSVAHAQNMGQLKPDEAKEVQAIRARFSSIENEAIINVTMYPNPAKNIVTLTTHHGDWTIDRCEIYDILGLLITTIPGNKFDLQGDSFIAKFDFTQPSTVGKPPAEGVYMVKFYYSNDDSTTSKTRKLIYNTKE